MSKRFYPPANKKVQNFEGKYPGSVMNTNCFCIHTTEGMSWPGYAGGSEAPNMTGNPIIKRQRLRWRQHFPADRSARGLENHTGGVETNTLNVFQIELVGTCNPDYAKHWGKYHVNEDYIYWPEAPDWAIADVADVVKWLARNWPNFNVVDGAPRGWLPYPDSYGASSARMTDQEWMNCHGIFGHQHVPENDHGDPGAFPIQKLIDFCNVAPTPAPHHDTLIVEARSEFDKALAALHRGNRMLIRAEKNGRTGAVRNARKDLQHEQSNIQHILNDTLPNR